MSLFPQSAAANNKLAGGRLTLESGVPVSTSDQSVKTTLYYAIYSSAEISLYYNGAWTIRTFAELSVAVTATANKMFDAFVYWDGAACQLELLAWTNDTTRATALTRQDGVLVKTGATDRRYVGSIRTETSGQTSDTKLKRLVWNNDNRCQRQLRFSSGTASWTYTSATIRQWRGNTGEQVSFCVGLLEDAIHLELKVNALQTAGFASVGIGINSTTAFGTGCLFDLAQGATYGAELAVPFSTYGQLGYNYFACLEAGDGINITTFTGTAATSQAGLCGWVWG